MQQGLVNIESKIQSFWEWFIETEEAIQEYFSEEEMVDKAALIESIDERVLDFGLFSWEIGPGVGRPFYLTISPNGSRERLRISKMIMESAPNLPDWEFHYAKPPKAWDLSFILFDDFMVEREVDASPWRYAFRNKQEGRVEVILEAQNTSHLDPDTRLIAGERAIANLLGEEVKINHVYRVEVVEALDEQDRAGSAPITELSQHLEALAL